MKIAVIDNYDSFVYNLIRYLKEENCETIVMRNDAVCFDAIRECDAILLSPGPGLPSEAGKMPQVIEEFYREKSILGVCLGHQALGEFFGGELVQEKEPFHGESSEITIEKSILMDGISSKTQVGRYHSWNIELPKKSTLIAIAQTEKKELMAFEHESLPIFGVQFHPESILTPEGRKMIQNWIQLVNKLTH